MTETQALGARPGANAGQAEALSAAESTSAVDQKTIGPNAVRYVYREEAAFALDAPEGSPVVKAHYDFAAEGILLSASQTVQLEHGLGKVPDILEVSQMPDTAPLTISADADDQYITVTNHNPDSEATAHLRAVSIPDSEASAEGQAAPAAAPLKSGKTLDQLAVEEARGYSPPEGPGAEGESQQAADATEQDSSAAEAGAEAGTTEESNSPAEEAPSRRRRRAQTQEENAQE